MCVFSVYAMTRAAANFFCNSFDTFCVTNLFFQDKSWRLLRIVGVEMIYLIVYCSQFQKKNTSPMLGLFAVRYTRVCEYFYIMT